MLASPSLTPAHTVAAGYPVHYVESGSGELLVLIHGSLCDYRYWRWQVSSLSGAFHVVAPSLPGCWPDAVASNRDEAARDPRYSIRAHADAIVDLCQQKSPDSKVVLLGHSRGAQVALAAALAMPQRMKALILADPGFSFTGESEGRPVHASIASELGNMPLDDVLGQFVDAVNGEGTWRKTVSWFKEMVRENAWTLIPQINDLDTTIELSVVARQLHCPLLLVGGEASPPRYGSRIEALQRDLPLAQHVVVPKAAHGMNLANAPYFNRTIREFLERHR